MNLIVTSDRGDSLDHLLWSHRSDCAGRIRGSSWKDVFVRNHSTRIVKVIWDTFCVNSKASDQLCSSHDERREEPVSLSPCLKAKRRTDFRFFLSSKTERKQKQCSKEGRVLMEEKLVQATRDIANDRAGCFLSVGALVWHSPDLSRPRDIVFMRHPKQTEKKGKEAQIRRSWAQNTLLLQLFDPPLNSSIRVKVCSSGIM